MKTVLNQDVNFNGATLSLVKEKVKTDKEITAKEAKEVVAPLAKKFFNIDITGYEVKWDDNTKN